MKAPEYITLDPEFEELLRLVATDRNSSLMRIPRESRIRSLFDRTTSTGPMEPGLSLAERELIQVHRNHLAWLLRQACLVKLIKGPNSKLYVPRFCRVDEQYPLLDATDIKRSMDADCDALQESHSVLHVSREATPVIALLEQCVAAPLASAPSVSEMAIASFRLEKTDHARIIAALDLAQSGAARTSIRLSREVLANQPNQHNATRSWQVLSLAYTKTGQHQLAYESQSSGCRTDPEDPWGQMNHMILALQLGDVDGVRSISESLNQLLVDGQELVEWFVRVISARRVSGEWAPTRLGGQLATSILDELGDTGRRIANVLV